MDRQEELQLPEYKRVEVLRLVGKPVGVLPLVGKPVGVLRLVGSLWVGSWSTPWAER